MAVLRPRRSPAERGRHAGCAGPGVPRRPSSETAALLLAGLAAAWLCLAMPVFAQESYYWAYAQHPDLSYFDHPPMVAWGIWLGTHLLGDGAPGIRLMTLLWALGTTLLGLLLLRRFAVDQTGRMAWIVASLGIPMLAGTHFLANPDAPLVFFWTATLYALWRARDGALGWWLLAGLAAGSALASKYTAVFLAVNGVLLLLLDPAMRRQILRPGPWLAMVAALLPFTPVLLWNIGNDFESFRFQTEGRWQNAGLGLRWLWQCLGGQFLVANPVLAILAPATVLWLLRRARSGDARALWLLCFALPMALYLAANSLFIQVKINWFAPVMVPLALGGVIWWRESRFAADHPGRARAARAAVVGFAALGLAAPLMHLLPAMGGTPWSGWDQIAARAEHWEELVDAEDGIEGNMFFFAANYRDSAQLGRSLRRLEAGHAGPGEELESTLSRNVFGQAALQFDHWDPPIQRIGQDAIFVLPHRAERPDEVARARACFDRVELVEDVEVRTLGILVARAGILVCRNYHGPPLVASRGR